MTPEEWTKQQRDMDLRHRREEKAHDAKRDKVQIPPQSELRPATAGNVREGAIIYHDTPDGWYWHSIDEVHRPDDDFKAYTADDGCRYGLHKAYVRK